MSDSPKKKSGAGIIALIAVLAVVAVVALLYLSGNMPGAGAPKPADTATAEVASSTAPAGGQTETATAPAPAPESAPDAAQAKDQPAAAKDAAPAPSEIKPGNPVVATVNGQQIMRADVFSFMANLPPNLRQIPVEQLFQLSLNQVVNSKLVESHAAKAGDLSNDPEVKEQLDKAKEQIVRNVYLEKQVDSKITEQGLKNLYDSYAEKMKGVQEIHAKHILVDSEQKAKDVIAKLNGGADFDQLAKENSTGPSSQQGGDLGWFAKNEMVPEFSEAAFKIEPGKIGDAPVKTQFGWHVIKVLERRSRPVPTFEEVKPMLETQARRQVLDEILTDWRKQADVKLFDINGNPAPEKKGEPAKAPEAAKP